jgi:hypothetical protein
MNTEIKSMGLMAQVAKGLLSHEKSETVSQLGDRSLYVGMSDIGKGAECMRAAVANKVYGSMHPSGDDIRKWYAEGDYEKIKAALKKQLILQRGHWLEAGIERAFEANGTKFFTQLEIDATDNGVPILAHLDFVLVWGGKRPAVRILELKSTENIPENLYSAYEVQLSGQLGFLYKYWNQPRFSIRDGTGRIVFDKLSFPELTKKVFGFDLPNSPQNVDIEGWVLCLAMSDAKAFGPYKPNATMLKFCEKTAKDIWQKSAEIRDKKLSLNNINFCKSFHPLCDYCSHAETCPKFKVVELKDRRCNDFIAELQEMKINKRKLEKQIEFRERKLKDFYFRSKLKDWLGTKEYRFRCSKIDGRKSLDVNTLTAELVSILGEDKAGEILSKSYRQCLPYQRLYIGKRK